MARLNEHLRQLSEPQRARLSHQLLAQPASKQNNNNKVRTDKQTEREREPQRTRLSHQLLAQPTPKQNNNNKVKTDRQTDREREHSKPVSLACYWLNHTQPKQ